MCNSRLVDLPLLLTVDEVAAVCRIGRNTAYQLVGSGEIRHLRIGRCIRVPRASLFNYLGVDEEVARVATRPEAFLDV